MNAPEGSPGFGLPGLEARPLPLVPRREGAPPTPTAPTGPAVRRGSWLRRLGVLVFLLLAGALAYGGWRHYSRHLQVMVTAEHQANFVPEVQVEAVMQRREPVAVSLPGTTLAFEEAKIFARASGYVLRRYVDIGDRVKAGQLLAEITAPEVEDQLDQTQHSLRQAEATMRQNLALQELARVTDMRSSALTKQGWASQQNNDVDRYNLDAQRQATQAAQAAAAATQAQLSYTNQQKLYQQVVAPFDGVVTQRNVDVGSLIAADATDGIPMFAMSHSEVIRVWVYVPQDDAFGVAPGVDATVRVPGMPHLTFAGKVTRIANALQPGTRTLLTEVDVPNPDGALSPGIYCTVTLQIPRKAPALIVPASAIIFNQNGMQVAVVEKGVARLHKVAITTDFGTEVEVSEGVREGDKVIIQPPVNLADGDRVEIKAVVAPAPAP